MKKILFALPLLLFLSCAKEVENPILTIEGGRIQGVLAENPGVYVYRGIPYAAPPIGNLRWKEPQPVVAWDSVRICDKFGHPGYQAVHYPGFYASEWGYGDEAPYSEDCLYLNVWTKAPGDTSKKLPVALWIHGGGYREGWGSEPEFDGQEWASKDVVLVTINYRLDIFGFMTHPELSAESPHHVSGNYKERHHGGVVYKRAQQSHGEHQAQQSLDRALGVSKYMFGHPQQHPRTGESCDDDEHNAHDDD